MIVQKVVQQKSENQYSDMCLVDAIIVLFDFPLETLSMGRKLAQNTEII